MSKVEGLPGSFKWEQDEIKWVSNHLKTKAYKRSTDAEISSLIKQFYGGINGITEDQSEFEDLIANILKTGDSGKLFIKTLSATWRARKARQGKKHYNLSLESSTYKKLEALAKRSSVPNSSIKQALTDLINDTYETKIEAQKKNKAQQRAKVEHTYKLSYEQKTDREITALKDEVESLRRALEYLHTPDSNSNSVKAPNTIDETTADAVSDETGTQHDEESQGYSTGNNANPEQPSAPIQDPQPSQECNSTLIEQASGELSLTREGENHVARRSKSKNVQVPVLGKRRPTTC